MNYLAHAWLSFGKPGLITGNLINDFVRGKKQYDFPEAIQQGIRLHRAIDNYTDTHDITREAKTYFRKDYRLYAGAFVDVVYDHFLATDTHEFATPARLKAYAQLTYNTLEQHYNWLPDVFKPMFESMRSHDWLFNYQFKTGIERSFRGLVYRSKYLTDATPAFAVFENEYEALQDCYRRFFPQLKQYCIEFIS